MKKIICYIFFLGTIVLFTECQKRNGCILPGIVPEPTYQYPIWFPDGKSLSFNHTPLKSIKKNGRGSCFYYTYEYKTDSIGFWTIDADGSNKRRLLDFELVDPAWSPDGKWIAYSDNLGTIYKMPFDGVNLLPMLKVALTTNGNNFSPSWSPNGDSISFDSNVGTFDGSFRIWKMRNDGSGKKVIISGRDPYWFKTFLLYIGSDSVGPGLFKMNFNTQQKVKLLDELCTTPKSFGNTFLYESYGLWKGDMLTGVTYRIFSKSAGYDVSVNGKIAFVNFDWEKLDSVLGTIWTMDLDGKSLKQLTFNKL